MAKLDPLAIKHSIRWRKVSNRFPLTVHYAYGGDIAQALQDDDATVFERVRQWEISEGIEPRDWVRWGKEEEGRDED